jgi:ABC-type spermidine/putrescine transport system permease subunit II
MRGNGMAVYDDFDAPAERSTEELKRIARYQSWLIAVVLAQLALWGGFIALMMLNKGRFNDRSLNFPIILTFILGAVGGIYVFMLSWELRGGFAAIVFGLATILPCMGLLILTLVNGYATAELRKHGIAVGVFGASPSDVDARESEYENDDEDAGW